MKICPRVLLLPNSDHAVCPAGHHTEPAHAVAQSGRATVLLSPFMPDQLQDLPARRWITDIHFALLDCTDTTRTKRLEDRPIWREHNTDRQLAFAEYLRTHIPTAIPTDNATPAATAQAIATWVRELPQT